MPLDAERDYMNILFITEPYVIDPIGIAYLSAALKKNDHVVKILRTCDLNKSTKDLVQFHPDILAYSVYTGRQNFYVNLNRNIRRFLTRHHQYPVSIFGGPHPTFFSEIIKKAYVDVVCQGEFDLLISDMINRFEHGKILRKYVFKADMNPQDLDALPFPDRELIYQFPENANNPIKNIMTSRGCPFSCPYCYNSAFNKMFTGKTVRYRSVDSVIEEAAQLLCNYPQTKYIFFVDDEFVSKISRLAEFSEKWIKNIAIPFHAQLRIDLVTEEKVMLLKEAGCTSITFAIETGNEKKRKTLLRRKISNETILNAARILRKHNILFRTENMLALPNETVDEAIETLDLNIACKPTIGWSSLFQPYPKTDLGELAVDQKLFDGKLEDIPSTFFEKSVLKIPEGQKRRFENLQRLFGFICSHPFLRIFVRFLIWLPMNRIYNHLYAWHKKSRYDVLFKFS